MGMKRTYSLGLVLCLALATAGCAAKTNHVRFVGTPDDALVTINDRYIGTLGNLARRGVMLEAGEYRITVEQLGFFPQDQLVVVEDDQVAAPVKVELTEIPD